MRAAPLRFEEPTVYGKKIEFIGFFVGRSVLRDCPQAPARRPANAA
jgi:hypothetical protein